MIGFTTWVSFCFFWMQSSHDHPAVLKRINRWVVHPSLIKQSKISGSICGSMWVHLLLWCLQVFNHGPMEEKYEKPEAPSTPPEASPFWPFSNLGWRALWGRPSGRGPSGRGRASIWISIEDVSRKQCWGDFGLPPGLCIWMAWGGGKLWLSSLSHPPMSRKLVQQTKTARHNDRHGPDSLSNFCSVCKSESLLRVYWESTESLLSVLKASNELNSATGPKSEPSSWTKWTKA